MIPLSLEDNPKTIGPLPKRPFRGTKVAIPDRSIGNRKGALMGSERSPASAEQLIEPPKSIDF
jgi:hypothetical protein